MKIQQTSPTTFELQSDNGCTCYAGYAVETMGEDGVYSLRTDFPLRRDQVLEIFHRDPRVQDALEARKSAISRMMREREQAASALVAAVCAVGLLACAIGAVIAWAMQPSPVAAYSICERCGMIIGEADHGNCFNKEIK